MADFKFWKKRVYTAAKAEKKGIANARYSTSDVAQESMLQLLQDFSDSDESEKYNDTYLKKVGQGNARNMLRKNMAQKRAMNAERHTLSDEDIRSGQKSPLDLLQDREDVVVLINAIAKLPENQQAIVYQRFFDQKTWTEIAEIQGLTVDITRRQCEKALNYLRTLLSRELPGDQ